MSQILILPEQKNKSDNIKRQERKINGGGEGENMRKEGREYYLEIQELKATASRREQDRRARTQSK